MISKHTLVQDTIDTVMGLLIYEGIAMWLPCSVPLLQFAVLRVAHELAVLQKMQMVSPVDLYAAHAWTLHKIRQTNQNCVIRTY